jgi:hypothetical protein
MAKRNPIDPDEVKSIGTMAHECNVPERWLRNRVAAREVASRRIGYNLFVPMSEVDKIKKLAQIRWS